MREGFFQPLVRVVGFYVPCPILCHGKNFDNMYCMVGAGLKRGQCIDSVIGLK